MNRRLTLAEDAVSDDGIRAMFEARAARADDTGMADTVMVEIARTRQVGGWRRRLAAPAVQSPFARPLVLGVVLLAILALMAIAVGASRTPPRLPPTGEIHHLRPAFEYRLPPEIEARRTRFGSMIQWVGSFAPYDPAASEPPYAIGASRAIVVANADTAWSHGASGSRVRLGTTLEGLLEDIRDRSHLPLPAEHTSVDGRPALTARSDRSGANDLHFSEKMLGLSGDDYIVFRFPMRLTLVDVDGSTMIIVAWARTADELADWIPTADAFIDSIHFIDP
jgi:hypothetical protein